MTYVEPTPLPHRSPPIGASWWHVALWTVFGPGLSLIPAALLLGDKSPLTYLVAVGLWVSILVIGIRHTRSWRESLRVQQVQIEQRTLEGRTAWDKPDAIAARDKLAKEKVMRDSVLKVAKERQFAEWARSDAEQAKTAALRAEYERSGKRP